MKKIYFLAFTILFSCLSEQEKKAANEISALFKTESVSISKGFETSTNDEDIDYVGVTIENPKVLEDSSVNPEALLSIASLSLYSHLDEQSKKERNAIKVVLKSNGEGGEKEYSRLVKIQEIEEVNQSIETIQKFTSTLKNRSFEESYNFFSKEFKAEFPKDILMQEIARMATLSGNIKDYQINDFKTTTVTHSGVKIPAIGIRGVLVKDTIGYDTKFYINKNQKIVGFDF
jgi:hypothetical protein